MNKPVIRRNWPHLSRIEKRVAQLKFSGKRDDEIAEELGMPVHEVRRVVLRVLRKLRNVDDA